MKYVSTRGKSPAVESSAAIMNGLAPDGGLYVPETIPEIDVLSLRGMTYRERAERILGLYLTDFTAAEIADCVARAYTPEKFGAADPAPVTPLGETMNLLELWHGPTCAFKDMALQLLPQLLSVSLKKQGEKRTAVILVATSGDTGKAALEGFCDAEQTRILVFYPSDGVSEMQKLQMITQRGGNVRSCAIIGNFDDAQNGVKAIFSDEEIRAGLDKQGCFLSSANSINFGRLVPQIVYYIDGYLKLVEAGRIKPGEKINITVPTGNFGNILAGYMAYRMGLPVGRFICASNANDVLTEFVSTGVYDRRRKFYATMSPSMDILISSNLERMLWYLADGDGARVSSLMAMLKSDGVYSIDDAEKARLKALFTGGSVDENGTREVIRKTYEDYKYVCDTHTAVAVGAYEQYRRESGDGAQTLIASTASPFKFSGSVLSALGGKSAGDGFEDISRLEKYGISCPEQISGLRGMEVRFPGVIDRDKMAQELFDFIK